MRLQSGLMRGTGRHWGVCNSGAPWQSPWGWCVHSCWLPRDCGMDASVAPLSPQALLSVLRQLREGGCPLWGVGLDLFPDLRQVGASLGGGRVWC